MNNSTPHIPMSKQQAHTPGARSMHWISIDKYPSPNRRVLTIDSDDNLEFADYQKSVWSKNQWAFLNESDEQPSVIYPIHWIYVEDLPKPSNSLISKAYLIPELEEEIRRLKKENENLLLEHGRISDEISILGSEYHGIKQAWNTLSKLKQ